jgi:hypothetical protein
MYLEFLEVPKPLYTRLSAFSVLMLVRFRCSGTKQSIKAGYQRAMKGYLKYTHQNYFNIFVEKSENEVQNFFADPLIQFLWTKFRFEC